MLPEGWQRSTVSDCVDLLTGYAFPSQAYADAKSTKVRLLRGDNVMQGSLRWDDARHWPTPYDKQLARYEMRTGDIVIAMDRPIVNAGLKCSAVQEHDLPCLLVQRVARLRAKNDFDQGFLAQVLQTHGFIQHLKGQKTETAVPHISPNDIRDFAIAAPGKSEQHRIARVLSTWDQAIATTERLLANSRRQKQSLLNALMRRMRRTQSRADKWDHIDLNAIFERVTRKNIVGNTNVLTISGERGLISQRDYFNKSVASANLSGYTLLLRGEFAYNKSYSAGYPMGAIKPLTHYEAGVVSSLYLCFRMRGGADASADFFRHYFEAGMLNEALGGIAQEGARAHGLLNVGLSDFFKLRLQVPPASEQRRIAEVINVAEAEKKSIEGQVAALKKEKTALMAQLLTGMRRVKVANASEVDA